jgi:ribose transport system ATP-binding protein
VIEYRNVSKKFGPFNALSDVSFAGHSGSVHAVTGENGAGKSTLMKLLAGAHAPSAGEILMDGVPLLFDGADKARAAGIATVFQELTLLENLTVAENLFLGREPRRCGMISGPAMRSKARVILDDIGINVDVDRLCGSLTVGEQHLVEIAKSAVLTSRIVIYDEPTAALDATGVDKLLALIARQRAEGKLIFYISHRLDEIFQICDTITVLKDGVHMRTCPTSELTRDSLVSLMVGRELGALYPQRAALPQDALAMLTVENMIVKASTGPVSFTLRKGEIAGLAGLEGQGQRELIRTIAGFDPPASGTATRRSVSGAEVVLPHAIAGVVKAGVGFVPEDRKSEGLYLPLSIERNIALGNLRSRPLWSYARKDSASVANLMKAMNIAARGPDQPVGALSGGNQQKVMIGRWINSGVDILLIEEPTRGVDVGAKAEIYRLLRKFTADGGAVLLTSSEMTEHIGICDRILVVRDGAIVAELDGATATEEQLARHALMGTTEVRRSA